MTEIITFRKKICVLGDPAVGKTSLIKQYVYHQFSDVYISTIGTEVTKKEISIDYQDDQTGPRRYDISFAIWDIIGQIEYRSLITRFFKNANGVFIVCDLTREDTIENMNEWATSLSGTIGKVPIVFVGNKYDQVDSSTFNGDELMEISSRYSAPWIATSAKNGANVELMFKKLGELIVKNSLFFERINSLIDVLDAIIVDFCEVHGGLEVGMPIFKNEYVKIQGANLGDPKKEFIENLIAILSNITRDKKGKEIAGSQNNRYLNWLNMVEHDQ